MLKIKKVPFCSVSHSDTGDVRATNEDSVFAESQIINGHNIGLFAVSDGCGGLQCGEDASRLAVETVGIFWRNQIPDLASSFFISFQTVAEQMENMMQEAQLKVKSFADEKKLKSAATLTVLLLIDRKFWIKHVGDSRVYRLQNGSLECMTEDQTVVADMLRNREITEAEAKHCNRSVLSMNLGTSGRLFTYSGKGKIKSGDVFLVCSDGLYAFTNEEMLRKQLLKNHQSSEEMRNLIAEGKARDNVSFVIVWKV
jgi:serine/threonine protein phosphatase PrpC